MGFILVFPDNFLDIIIFKKKLGKKDVFGSKKRPFLRNSGFSQNQKSHIILDEKDAISPGDRIFRLYCDINPYDIC